MAVVDGLQDLLEHLGGVGLFEELLGNDPIEQLASLAQLSDEVNVLRVLEVLVQLDDVWVIQGLQNFDLLLKTLPILDLLPLDCLAGSLLTADFVSHFSDDSIGARTKGFLLEVVYLLELVLVFGDHGGFHDHELLYCFGGLHFNYLTI